MHTGRMAFRFRYLLHDPFGGLRPNTGIEIRRLNQRAYSALSKNSTAHEDIKKAVELLQKHIGESIEPKREQLKRIKQQSGNVQIGAITPNMVSGGMRGMTAMLTETSSLDAINGITYRGHTLADLLNSKLPKRNPNDLYPSAEAAIWLLMTGKIPTVDQVHVLQRALYHLMLQSSTVQPKPNDNMSLESYTNEYFVQMPEFVPAMIHSLPDNIHHPMSQLVSAAALLSDYSFFKHAYQRRLMKKDALWKVAVFDSLSLVAKMTAIAAHIYRTTFHDGVVMQPDIELDLASNFGRMIGKDTSDHVELLRLYLILHADHEGGNVSAHTAHLVGSAHADPFSAYSAGMAGLGGPLHGLANQECLRWLRYAYNQLGGDEPTVDNVRKIAQDTLSKGQVIPGFGHAVLRVTDPRFTAQREFALKCMKDDPLFRFLDIVREVVPKILLETGKVQNPYPNVDCHSGLLLQHFGFTEEKYYTVLFGISRSIGISSQYVWSRALGMPIERPKSITVDALEHLCQEKA